MMFSIIATHYDKSVTDEELQRFLDSLASQTYKDFEIIILHDGPRNRDTKFDTKGMDAIWLESEFRGNCWGHNLRSIGMKKAKGEYIINTNTDNVYYEDALELIADSIQETQRKVFIGTVVMKGLNRIPVDGGIRLYYDTPRDYNKFTLLSGNPPVFGNIDLMSLIAHKDVWKEVNYWYDLRPASDALIYEDICKRYIPVHVDVILGEHY